MAIMGRPKKYSTKDIKDVIDMYVSFTGGTVLLNASKIAEYAEKKLGLNNFKYYVINRNSEAKQYVKSLNENITNSTEKKLTSAVTTFTQINVRSYQSMNTSELGQALTNLNTLLEDMANSNTKLLKENLVLKNTVREKEIEIKKLNDLGNETTKNFAEDIDDLKRTVSEQKKIINGFKQAVKQSEDVNHLLWDKEAEIIMKHTGVFENDGVAINPKRIITDIEQSMTPVVKDVNELDPGKISNKFMDRLKKI